MAHPQNAPTTRRKRRTQEECMAAHTRLNLDEFEKVCRLRDLNTDDAIAKFLDVAPITVGRIRRGERGPGGDFIAAVVLAFEPYGVGFKELFVTERDPDEAGSAA
jgi:hypothetical protein